jgi:hypothetical protein
MSKKHWTWIKTIEKETFYNSHVIVLCINSNDPRGLDNVKDWMTLIETGRNHDDSVVMMASTKMDEPKFHRYRLKALAEEYEMLDRYFETSAILEEGVNCDVTIKNGVLKYKKLAKEKGG